MFQGEVLVHATRGNLAQGGVLFLWCSKFLEEKKDKGNFGNERSEACRRRLGPRDNPADMMTKPVPVTKFELCSGLVGITV